MITPDAVRHRMRDSDTLSGISAEERVTGKIMPQARTEHDTIQALAGRLPVLAAVREPEYPPRLIGNLGHRGSLQK